jgi:tetratricopeptide (TPR) repeat protein
MFLTDWDGGFYWMLVTAACLGAIAVSWAKQHLQQTFGRFGGVPASCGLTGALVARRLLAAVGLAPVTVVRSNWLNCYHPRKREVQLRDETFDGESIAALAIAAHEVGHAQQFAGGYWPARLRLWLRPVYLGLLIALLGSIVLTFTYLAPVWTVFIFMGIAFIMLLAQVPTVVPLECDASRRAKALVLKAGMLAPYEEASFDRLLKAASRTYLAWECQRWSILVAGGIALFWLAPGFPAEQTAELTPVAPVVPPRPNPIAGVPRVGERASIEPAVPGELPMDPETLDIDLTYPLLSSLGTLVPAGLLVLVMSRFANPRRKRPTSPETAVARNNAGLGLWQRGEWGAAIEAYSSALKLDPKLHAAYYNRGQCYLAQGQLDPALADIEASLRLNPHFIEAFALRAHIWTQRAKYDCALADLNQALQLAPNNAVALTCRGNFRMVQGDHDSALADFNQAIANAPQYGSAYLGRAKVELARGNTDAALVDCCQGIAFGADAGDACSVRSRIWMEKREYDRAIADLTACLKKLPNQAWLYSNRGLAYYLKGDYPSGLADLNQALELDPSEAFAYNNRGAAYLKMGNFAAAKADLEKAINLKPDFPNPHKHLAWLQATCPLGEFRDGASAVQHAERALELAKENRGEYLAILAAACAEVGDFSRALDFQSKCVEASRPESTAEMRERLQRYESGRPFRDVPAECTAATN